MEKSLRQASAQTRNFGGALARVGKLAAFSAGAAGVGGLVVGLQRGAKEFAESQKVLAQTAAALKSTGRAAGVSGKHITKLAQSLSNMSGVDDELIQSSENLLLTFTHIQNKAGKGNKIFDQATKTILDMSVALGQDTKSSAIQLGKALNDPIKGVTALRRVGVSFTADQLKQIEVLVKSGKTMQAQKLILGELSKEFGGSAKAAGSTFAGSLNKLRNTFDNLAGSIVGSAAPALQKYVDHLNVWLSKSENQEKIQRAVTKTMKVLGQVVSGVSDAIRTLAPLVQGVVDKFGGWKRVLELLVAIKAATWLSGVAGGLAGVGGKATLANKNVLGLRKSLLGLNGLKISVSLLVFEELIRHKGAIENFIDKLSDNPIRHFSDDALRKLGLTRLQKPLNRAGNIKPPPVRGPTGPIGPIKVKTPSVQGATGATGAIGGRANAAVHFNGPITVVANDPDVFVRELQKRARRIAGSRAGPQGGVSLGLA